MSEVCNCGHVIRYSLKGSRSDNAVAVSIPLPLLNDVFSPDIANFNYIHTLIQILHINYIYTYTLRYTYSSVENSTLSVV